MTELADFTYTGGAEQYISTEELSKRPEVHGYAVDNVERTFRADDAIFATEHDDGSVTLDVSFSEAGLIDRTGEKLIAFTQAVDSGYPPNLQWVAKNGNLPLSLSHGEGMKPTITVSFDFNPDGRTSSYTVYRSRTRAESRDRPDFERQLNDSQPEDELWPLKQASRFIRSNRHVMQMAEEVWKPINRSRLSDFSILANLAVSHAMYQHDTPWLYRNYHPEQQLVVGDIHEHELPEIIEQLFQEASTAYFTASPIRHDGLGLNTYGYATGQLSELSKRINGIMLTRWFDQEHPSITHANMDSIARWINTRKFDGNARKRYPELFATLDVVVEEIY